MEYITYILLGSVLMFIFLYLLEILLLMISIHRIKTNNGGIKNLKFQDFNHAWNKFVLRKI